VPPPDVLTPAEVRVLVSDPRWVEELGQPSSPALLVVDLRGGPGRAGALPESLDRVPCVTVALTGPAGDDQPDARPARFDVVLTEPNGSGPVLPDAVPVTDLAATLAELGDAVAAQPVASRVLVQVLRASARLSVADALVVESLAYSTLQSGPHFARWRASRPARPIRSSRGPAATVHRHGHRLDIVLNRPEVHNAFSAAMRDAVVEGLELAALDETVTEVHLRGAGPTFSSGGDLDEFGSLPDPASAHVVRVARSAGLLLAGLQARVVVHAAGPCRGAGAELAAFADEVRVIPGTSFGLPEIGLGLIPGAGGTVSLPRRIGRQRTAYLGLTGRPLDAATAIAWGLADSWEPSS
jgi:hypothetical protein